MNVLADCIDCTASETPTYMWTLEENVSGVWTPIDLSSKAANGRSIIPKVPRVFLFLVMHDLYQLIYRILNVSRNLQPGSSVERKYTQTRNAVHD